MAISLRKTLSFLLGFGLLSLSSVCVRCFATDESRHNLKHRHGLTPIVRPIPSSLEKIQKYRLPASFAGNDNSDSKTTPSESPAESSDDSLGNWPCFDEMDKSLIAISLPVMANYAINPLIGAVDLFWVNRMGDALAVAGQAAANQVFSSAFWCISFLPSGKHTRGEGFGCYILSPCVHSPLLDLSNILYIYSYRHSCFKETCKW
jgi:hypothetical protein